jgi:RNA polymerase sigma-70 factor (ECF subfamily)
MRLELAAVRRAIEALPAEQRAVLMLVTVDGRSYREAAEILDTPIGTVMSRLARARLALTKQRGSADAQPMIRKLRP